LLTLNFQTFTDELVIGEQNEVSHFLAPPRQKKVSSQAA
jgi:hypothetical protein